ncbi:hypothetical protein JCM8547_006250 [Rhodosporidiobolus lusitaniae]
MSSNALEAKDYLTSLPNELLQLICRLVQWRDLSSLALVSKAFVPFVRSGRFSKRTFYSLARLDIFNTLVDTSPGVGAYVKKLTVTLTDPFLGWSNPFDPSHYAQLRRHGELKNLELQVNRTFESLGRYRSPRVSKTLESKWRWSLLLRGPLAANPAIMDFFDLFVEVHTLIIYGSTAANGTSVPVVVASLPYPDVLDTLSLDLPARPASFTNFTSLLIGLSTFNSLKVLRFKRHSCGASQAAGLWAEAAPESPHSLPLTPVQHLLQLARGSSLFGCLPSIRKTWRTEMAQQRHVRVSGWIADWVRAQKKEEEHKLGGKAVKEEPKSDV